MTSPGDDLRAGAQLDDIVEHQLVCLQFDDLAVAHDVGARRIDDAQLVEHLLGAQFLHDADDTVRDDDAGEQCILRRAGGDHERRQDSDDEVDRRKHVAAHDLADTASRCVRHQIGLTAADPLCHFGSGQAGGGIGTGRGHAVKLSVS